MALVQDPDFNIMQQSHDLFAIAKLLVNFFVADYDICLVLRTTQALITAYF